MREEEEEGGGGVFHKDMVFLFVMEDQQRKCVGVRTRPLVELL